jgi:hypothetical protein
MEAGQEMLLAVTKPIILPPWTNILAAGVAARC